MSTASHERGLSLRSPGRFCAAAARLVELWQRAGDPADTALRRPGRRRLDRGAGLPAAHVRHRRAGSRPAARWAPESSLGKVFWSELESALHETALDLLGPQAELAGRRRRTALAGRLPVLPGRPDLRGHERDPAHGHRRAAAGPAAMTSARSAEQEQFAAALHDLLTGGAAGTGGPGDGSLRAARRWAAGDRSAGLALWRQLAGAGVTALAVPERAAGSAPARWTWWSPARNSVTTRCPGRWPSPSPPCRRCSPRWTDPGPGDDGQRATGGWPRWPPGT